MGIGASITLLAIGAILAFAVTIDSTPVAGMTVEWDTVGLILMVLGVVGLVWSVMVLQATRRRGASTIVTEQPPQETWVER